MTDRTAGEKPQGVWIERRLVPFPASLSVEARSYLEQLVNSDGTLKRPASAAWPADNDGWIAAKSAFNAEATAIFESLAASVKAKTETVEVEGVVVHIAQPEDCISDDRVYLDIHGGSLVFLSGEPCRFGAAMAADEHRTRCYAVDYRTPPEHPYPAALDDCVTVYRALLKQYRPENIIIGGTSAGGNLAAATVLKARDLGLPLPAAVILMTPELDLTESGDSFAVNQIVDLMLPGSLQATIAIYAGDNDLRHPYLSPLFGDFEKGFPPTLLQAGTRDLFLSNAARMHASLRRVGVPVELHVCEGMTHGGFFGAPEDLELRREVRRFVRDHWGRRPAIMSDDVAGESSLL